MLSRQWKNILYTPLMSQYPFKQRLRPMNVTITVPDIQEVSIHFTVFLFIKPQNNQNKVDIHRIFKSYYLLLIIPKLF